MMKGSMLIISHNNKIFNSIIAMYSIYMMNYLSFFQWTIKMFFHYHAMFRYFFTFNVKNPISTLIDMACSVFCKHFPKSSSSFFSIIMLRTITFTQDYAITVINGTNFILPKVFRIFFVFHDIIIQQNTRKVNLYAR